MPADCVLIAVLVSLSSLLIPSTLVMMASALLSTDFLLLLAFRWTYIASSFRFFSTSNILSLVSF